MATDALGITDIENKQIAALDAGATPEEASLNRKLPVITPVVNETSLPGGREEDLSARPEEGFSSFNEDFSVELGAEDTSVLGASESLDIFPVTEFSLDLDDATLDLLVLKASVEPERDISELYEEGRQELLNTKDRGSVLELYRQRYATQLREIVVQSTVGSAAAGEVGIEDARETLRASEELREAYSGLKGQERIFAENLAPLDTLDITLENNIARNYAWSKYNSFRETIGIGKWTANLAGEFFASFDALKDAGDLMDGSFITGKKDLLGLVEQYNRTDPRLRPEFFDEIFEKAVEAYDGNHFKLAGFVELFHSFTPDTDFNIKIAEGAFDILTSSTLLWGVKVLKGVAVGTSMASKAKQLQAVKEAVSIDNAPKTTSDILSRTNNASVFDVAEELPYIDSTDGLAKEHLLLKEQLAKEITEEIFTPVNKTLEDAERNSISALEDVEKERVVQETIETLRKRAEDEAVVFTSAKPVEMEKDGFTLEYTWDGVEKTERRQWLRDDAGTYIEINKDFQTNGKLKTALTFIMDPSNLLKNVSDTIVDKTTFGSFQSAKIKAQLINTLKATSKGLSKKQRLAVDELIKAGDQERRAYSMSELLDGTVSVKSGQRPYDDKEVKAYFKRLAFNRKMWELANITYKKEHEFMGAKTLNINFAGDGKTTQLIGVPGKDFRAFPVDMKANERVLVPHLEAVSGLKRADIDIDKLKAEGYIPVRLTTAHRGKDGKTSNWAIIKDDGPEGTTFLSDLPDIMLNWDPWYSPRIYNPGMTFVKDLKTGETIKPFLRKRDADNYARQLVKDDPSMQVEAVADRDFTRMEALSEMANSYGGPFTGARKSVNLELGDGGELERLSYNDAMNRYINNISETMPLNEYRMSMKERWINTVNELAKAEGKGKPHGIDPTADWKTAEISISEPQLKKQMEFTRDYMLNQFKVWSTKERSWNKFMTTIAQVSEGKGIGVVSDVRDRVADAALNLAHKEPMKALRAATFHAHLGWFNMRQLYIQAQNSTLAISMHPIHGMGAATDMLGMRALLHMTDETLERVKLENTAGLGHLVDDVKEFKAAGLEASILNNADYAAQKEGITPGTLSFLKRVSKAGLGFYQNGELSSRLVSWGVAKRNLGLHRKALTPQQVQEVTKEVNRIHMNLQSTNAAKFQQNAVTANATQFLQVQTKFVTNVMTGLAGKGEWSRAEAANAAVGQILMYGVIGVPIAEESTEWLMDTLGISAEELQRDHPNTAEFIGDGAIGALMGSIGFQNQFGGDTASLWGAMDDNIITGVYKQGSALFSGQYGEDSIGEVALGPSANTVKRTYDAVINTVNSVRSLSNYPTLGNVEDSMAQTLDDYLSIFSSYNYARQVREMDRLNTVFSKTGKTELNSNHLANMNMLTKLAQIAGIPSDILTAKYSLAAHERDIMNDRAARKKELKRAQIDAIQHDRVDRYKGMLGWFATGMDPIDYAETIQEIDRDIYEGQKKSETDKLLKRHRENLFRKGGFNTQLEITNIVQPQLDAQEKNQNGE